MCAAVHSGCVRKSVTAGRRLKLMESREAEGGGQVLLVASGGRLPDWGPTELRHAGGVMERVQLPTLYPTSLIYEGRCSFDLSC